MIIFWLPRHVLLRPHGIFRSYTAEVRPAHGTAEGGGFLARVTYLWLVPGSLCITILFLPSYNWVFPCQLAILLLTAPRRRNAAPGLSTTEKPCVSVLQNVRDHAWTRVVPARDIDTPILVPLRVAREREVTSASAKWI